jgi:hypothetical protein
MIRRRQAAYLQLNGKYLKEADDLLSKKDLVQASEKVWGACAEMVKAVAAKRGIELGTHASLWEFVSRINKEHPGWGLLDQFSYAGNLHTNFYEGWLTEDYVRRGLEIATDFVAQMKKLL